MNVGDKLGVYEGKFLASEALDFRKSFVHDGVDGLAPGHIDPEVHHAFGVGYCIIKVGEESVETN